MSAAKPSALIIAGGRGTRFWPESRAWRPKPLFSIDGQASLLADTIARVAPVTGRARTFVLVSADQHAIFRKALRGLIPPANLIVEPSGRGTAVAIGIPALKAEFTLPALPMVTQEKVLKGSLYGSCDFHRDIPLILSLYTAGKLKLDELITKTYPLEQINEAFEALERGDGARGVIRFDL